MHVPKRAIRPQRSFGRVLSLSEGRASEGPPHVHEAGEEATAAADDSPPRRAEGMPPSRCVAEARIPTRQGEFDCHVFRAACVSTGPTPAAPLEHEDVAWVFGDVRGRPDVLVRVHSECITSEVFGSLKCDCKDQLDEAMASIARAGAGAVLYLRQEGRGIGLANKIRAYALQSDGHDTIDANRLLGLPDDARRYDVARDMLAHLGIVNVRLLTNNPAKVKALHELGVNVVARDPLVVAPNQHSASYLETKRRRMQHDLPGDWRRELCSVSADAE
ncbi:MAG TPA: GTP cyclohydrolase II [Polyangiaceae bacterium]|nr:GTP cyclohydrolase II [Polyangiaceae bacterium]